MDYSMVAATALSALEQFGMDMTLSRQGTGTFNPATGDYLDPETGEDTRTELTWIIKGIAQAANISSSGSTGERYFNGVLVQTDDQQVILAALGIAYEPQVGDQITIGSLAYSLVSVIAISPAGTPLVYKALARK